MPSTTTTSYAPIPLADSGSGGGHTGNLASTGFDNGWLIWAGALLLLLGGGLLGALRLRRRSPRTR
ncbi:LPXTG cell wall anchor domain-containing protein [Amycolatopsis sp. H20-H5]|uniref:LPXTG cell wall anchor domain-containing protein n=1 Tax=Amycolatopsis sp. H20-H5 TaxID=3046309 RepID=UPI003FA35A26